MTKKILLVDDSPMHLENLKKALAATTAKLYLAKSGKEAVEMAIKEQPDLIFMDIVMDDQDGYHACRTLSKNDETKNIPVVFVTTKANRADKIWAERQGCQGFISKPFETAEIMAQVQRFCP